MGILEKDSLKDLRILIVDDETRASEALRELLETRGAVVSTASSIDKAMYEITSSKLPDVTLIDVQLGQENGMELARTVRQKYPQIGIVCISGYPAPDDIGDYCFVGKPIDYDRYDRLIELLKQEANKKPMT